METKSPEVTEVKCEENKGGLKFEVILAEANPTGTPPRRVPSPTNTPSTIEKIEQKLKAAEERRVSLESTRKANIKAKLERASEAKEKRETYDETFKNSTKTALEQKLEATEEKREAYISDMKAKLKDHERRVEAVRNNKVRLSNSHEEETEETTASSG